MRLRLLFAPPIGQSFLWNHVSHICGIVCCKGVSTNAVSDEVGWYQTARVVTIRCDPKATDDGRRLRKGGFWPSLQQQPPRKLSLPNDCSKQVMYNFLRRSN